MFNLRHRQFIRILMIEEESLVRAALVALVTSWKGFHVVAEAATKVQALEQFRRVDPDVVLLSLEGTKGATLVPAISRARTYTPPGASQSLSRGLAACNYWSSKTRSRKNRTPGGTQESHSGHIRQRTATKALDRLVRNISDCSNASVGD